MATEKGSTAGTTADTGGPVGTGDVVVQRGDGIPSIAEAHGHFWETLWNHAGNAALKQARELPHVLWPGDRVTVPPLQLRTESIATAKLHRYRRRGVPSKIHFVARNDAGEPFAGKDYRLEVGSDVFEGKTDGDGALEHWVAASARSGKLTVWIGEPYDPPVLEYSLSAGLDPIESLCGVQARLNNLGYYCGAEDGVLQPATAAALRAFQRAHELEETGAADTATRDRLREVYGN